jgi:hypothetical protein
MAAILTIRFMPGDDIYEAFLEAIELAKITNVLIEFNFNGVDCIVNKYSSAKKGVNDYHETLKTQGNNKYARG